MKTINVAPYYKPLDAADTGSRTGGPSFSLANRLLRAIWQSCWILLARWTPPPLHPWRALVLKAFGANLGANCRVHASVKIWLPSNLTLGDNVLIGPGATIYNQGDISVDNDTVISQGAHLCASSHDVDDPNFQLILCPITIGKRCWVAAEAFVGPGTNMADGSILAARAALFEDTDPWTIYRGNPAVVLRRRERRAGAA